MSDHNSRNARSNEFPKWIQLNTVKPSSIMRNNGQIQMGVYIRIAVPGKVLGASGDFCSMQTFHVSYSVLTHVFGTFAKRSVIDNRIVCIVVDINHGGKIEVHTDLPELLTNPITHLFSRIQTMFTHSSQSHLSRKRIPIRFESHPCAPLCVHTDK